MGDAIPVRDNRDVLSDALHDWLAEITDGGFLSDYVIVAAASRIEDGRTWYATLAPVTQPPHVTLGLLHYGISHGEPDDD